ncbi:MAG: RluA family pseudouridine synthase [Bacteroidota bacterium]
MSNQFRQKKEDQHFRVTKSVELMSFLTEVLPGKNRNNIKTMLRENQILVNGISESQFNRPLAAGNEVTVKAYRGGEEKSLRGITILYKDNDLIAIDKHAGILSVPDKNGRQQTALGILIKHVKFENRSNVVYPIQRLERESSGVMLFARSEKIQGLFQKKWNDLVKDRVYLAVVEGEIENDEGTISSFIRDDSGYRVGSSQDRLKGDFAETSYRVIRRSRLFTMLEIRIKQGKRDQIRVHMAESGHPVIGDKKYGSDLNPSDRLGLHAWKLEVIHPLTGENIRIESPIPRKLSRLF